LWKYPDPSEIEPVGVPTGANGRVIAQATVRVPCAGVMKKFEMLIVQVEQHTAKARGISRTSGTMRIVRTVVFTPGIVEHCE